MLYKMHPNKPKTFLRLYNSQPSKAIVDGIQEYSGPDIEIAELFKEALKPKNKRVEYFHGTSTRTGNLKVDLSVDTVYHVVRYYKYNIVHESLTRLWVGLLDHYKSEIIEDLRHLGVEI